MQQARQARSSIVRRAMSRTKCAKNLQASQPDGEAAQRTPAAAIPALRFLHHLLLLLLSCSLGDGFACRLQQQPSRPVGASSAAALRPPQQLLQTTPMTAAACPPPLAGVSAAAAGGAAGGANERK